MSRFVVGFVAVVCGLTIAAFGQNRVIFDNQSGDPALVKLIGPTQTDVDVPNGAKVGTDASAGRYVIKVRYGTRGNYRYSKGDEFTVTETATARSETTITLHKVVAGNYDSTPISEEEFGVTALKDQKTNAPASRSTQRPWPGPSGLSLVREPHVLGTNGLAKFPLSYEAIRARSDQNSDVPPHIARKHEAVAAAPLEVLDSPDKFVGRKVTFCGRLLDGAWSKQAIFVAEPSGADQGAPNVPRLFAVEHPLSNVAEATRKSPAQITGTIKSVDETTLHVPIDGELKAQQIRIPVLAGATATIKMSEAAKVGLVAEPPVRGDGEPAPQP